MTRYYVTRSGIVVSASTAPWRPYRDGVLARHKLVYCYRVETGGRHGVLRLDRLREATRKEVRAAKRALAKRYADRRRAYRADDQRARRRRAAC